MLEPGSDHGQAMCIRSTSRGARGDIPGNSLGQGFTSTSTITHVWHSCMGCLLTELLLRRETVQAAVLWTLILSETFKVPGMTSSANETTWRLADTASDSSSSLTRLPSTGSALGASSAFTGAAAAASFRALTSLPEIRSAAPLPPKPLEKALISAGAAAASLLTRLRRPSKSMTGTPSS